MKNRSSTMEVKRFFLTSVVLACDFSFTFILCAFWKFAPAERPQIIFATFILDPKEEKLFQISFSLEPFSLSFFYLKKKWTPKSSKFSLKREMLHPLTMSSSFNQNMKEVIGDMSPLDSDLGWEKMSHW